jgi:hypothetical protein
VLLLSCMQKLFDKYLSNNLKGETYIGCLKPFMKKLNNKNNAYSVYKAYALNTLMAMIGGLVGDRTLAFKRDVVPELDEHFDCSDFKYIHVFLSNGQMQTYEPHASSRMFQVQFNVRFINI